jgi:beta-mannosidase
LIKYGTYFWNFVEKKHWKSIQDWMKGWGIKMERSAYKKIPPAADTPIDLHHAREVWETWRFHDFQPAETFDNGIEPGGSLEEFIANSQSYQSNLIQYGTECYRRAKYTNVTGLIQFDFCDPWPAVTWSVVDYWRIPKIAFDGLRRSMQPVLPSFTLPEKIDPEKATIVAFCVVNDLLEAFPDAECEWHLESGEGNIASASFPVSIPADSVSIETRLTLPSLRTGRYKLSVEVSSKEKIIGENWYELIII